MVFARAKGGLAGAAFGLLLAAAHCGSQAPTPIVPAPSDSAAPIADASVDPPLDSASPIASASASSAPNPCPAGMLFVDGTMCREVERNCLVEDPNAQNKLKRCIKYEEGKTICKTPEEKRQFCIDEYEYPNEEGAHPPWMVTWYEAQATCESKGKRLCYASEWITACEGPEHTPFPYGWERDNTACNIDNKFVVPDLDAMWKRDKRELERLDRSVPSGSMDRCVSGYGVKDLTGNMDEWVTSDYPPEARSKWAGLKGGGWGNVRNSCRPMTTSHRPSFRYYFITFRCCADAPGYPTFRPTTGVPAPSVSAEDVAPLPERKWWRDPRTAASR